MLANDRRCMLTPTVDQGHCVRLACCKRQGPIDIKYKMLSISEMKT